MKIKEIIRDSKKSKEIINRAERADYLKKISKLSQTIIPKNTELSQKPYFFAVISGKYSENIREYLRILGNILKILM